MRQLTSRLSLNWLNRAANRSHEKAHPTPAAVWRNPLYFFGFGLGTGAIPFAPGTFGTLMAVPFYLLLRPLPLFAYLIFTLLFIAASSWLCSYLSRNMQTHDDPGMCIDEFAGFFVTMIHTPAHWWVVVSGVILFRFFDIFKPWPISFLDEHVSGGLGMVLDDVVAGIVSCLILQLFSL